MSNQVATYGTKVFTQNYGYDGVNRLTSVSESGPGTPWSRGYTYDNVGNGWMSSNSGLAADSFTPTAGSVYDSSNHMNGSNAAYVSGNQTQIGGYAFTYDAENRLTSSTINGGTSTYSYDGDGHRVMKQSGGVTTVYVYDLQGELAAEYTTAGTPPAPPCTTCYLMMDHLGSTRMMTDPSRTVMALHDYVPFGQEIPSGTDGRDSTWGGVDPKLKFTGQERDPETTLDFFQARYFSSAQGRFSIADKPFADQSPDDPQSWNMFAYVRNNPLKYTDPTGDDCVYTLEQTDVNLMIELERGNCSKKGGTFVNGTIDENSLRYLGNSLDFGYTDATGGVGAFSLGLATTVSYGDLFISEMSRRRDASNQMILLTAGTSAATGAAVGAAAATGVIAAVIDGVAYTYEQLVALGPEVIARLVAAGKLSLDTLRKIGSQAPVLVNRVYLYLFAQGNNTTITSGIFNNNNYLRIGEGFKAGVGPVFRIAIGSKYVPLPSWLPGVVRGTLHIDLWRR